MIQSWENLVTDERTDGRTDRQKRVTSHKAVRLTSSVHHVGNQNKNKNKKEPSLFFYPLPHYISDVVLSKICWNLLKFSSL